jgi:hypothetical protein
MYLPFRLTSALFGILASGTVASVLVVGCAMSSPADLSPGGSPDLPGVDASSDPQPMPGAGSSGSSGGTDDAEEPDSGTTPPKDSGTTPPKDSGTPPPVDSGSGGTTAPSAGEILITEVMYDTTTPEPGSEWIELHSLATVVRKLSGLTLKDGADRTHVIGAGVTIAPGDYVVLARDKSGAISAKVPSASIVYEYGTGLADNAGILLANGATGGVSLMNGSTTLVSAPYGGWFTQAGGSSLQLKVLDSSTSTAKGSWCLSAAAWTAGSGNGTPGAANDCP